LVGKMKDCMNHKYPIGFIILIVAVSYHCKAFSEPVTGKERLKLIRADSLINIFAEEKEIIELWGAVQLQQGRALLNCDHAVWWEKEDRATLYGQVYIFDGKRELWADRVGYNGQERIETADGHVIMKNLDRVLTARQVIYRQEKEEALATGDVMIQDILENLTLQGGRIFHNRQNDYSLAEYDPVLVRIDTASQDTLRIYGLKMEVWGTDEQAVVTDSVHIYKGDLRARCRRAEYCGGEEVLVLTEQPQVIHRKQTMTGDSIDVFLDMVHFKGALIRGHAMIVSTDSIYQDKLKGGRIHVETEQDTVRKVTVENQAESFYHIYNEDDIYEGTNTVTGDRIELEFEDAALHRINVQSSPGQCTGIYSPADMVERENQGR